MPPALMGQPLLLTAGVLFFLILTGGRITLIASGETFARLTGETDYSLIMVQINGNAGDETVEAIRSAAGDRCRIQDRRSAHFRHIYGIRGLHIWIFNHYRPGHRTNVKKRTIFPTGSLI